APRRHPVGQVRRRVDDRVPLRVAALPGAAQGGGAPPDRRGGLAPALADALDGVRAPRRQVQKLRSLPVARDGYPLIGAALGATLVALLGALSTSGAVAGSRKKLIRKTVSI